MAKPENVIIQEPESRFHGQPAWTEDMYDNFVLKKKAGSTTVDYIRITPEFRNRHNFPEEIRGLALRTGFDETGDDSVTGEMMDQETFEAFLQAVEGRPIQADRNHSAFISTLTPALTRDIVEAISKSGLMKTKNGGMNLLADTVREAVHRHLSENHPSRTERTQS